MHSAEERFTADYFTFSETAHRLLSLHHRRYQTPCPITCSIPHYLFTALIQNLNYYKIKHARNYSRKALVGITVNQAKKVGPLNFFLAIPLQA